MDELETQPCQADDGDEDDYANGLNPLGGRRADLWGRLVPMNCRTASSSSAGSSNGRGGSANLSNGGGSATEVTVSASVLELELGRSAYVLGRRDDSDLQVLGSFVSSHHCRIFRVENGHDETIMIEDLSSNGTYVDGRPLEKGQKTVLQHGMEICLGMPQRRGSEPYFIFQVPKRAAAFLKPLSPFEQKYDVLQELGRGNFATVKLAVERASGTKYAVKIIERRRHMLNAKVLTGFSREVAILKSLQHKHIVAFKDYFEDGETIFLVQELASGGDLLEYVGKRGKLNEAEAKSFFLQMYDVLKYLRAQSITHRDLKPDNYLLSDDNQIKLADFGLAKGFDKDVLSTVCGTPAYLAPEVISQTGASYDARVDLYSTGVILYFLVTGKIPFDGSTQNAIFQQIMKGAVNWSFLKQLNISDRCINMISQLLQVDPDKRITLSNIGTHPWISGNEWAAVLEPVGSSLCSIYLFEGKTTIGRHPDNLVTIGDNRISGFHCTVTCSAGKSELLDQSSNGISINDGRVKGTFQLSDGDKVLLAPVVANLPTLEYVFRSLKKRKRVDFEVPNNEKKRKKSQDFVLRPLGAHVLERDFVIAGAITTIGRASECSIVLRHPSVSGLHCVVTVEHSANGPTAKLTDKSSNGTYLNENKLVKDTPTALSPGDTIVLSLSGNASQPIGFLFVDEAG
ncbi:kinase-like domain-containing protein [Zopfochytrium polystomum]|nr:kinase-like domain-containing protein [Zopfochytrium polystomum]